MPDQPATSTDAPGTDQQGLRAVFLDRDGVINEDTDYLCRMEDVVFTPRAVEALSRLGAAWPADALKIIVVTNQSALGRGMCSRDEFDAFTQAYLDALREAGAPDLHVDDYQYCPHHPTEGVGAYRKECPRRKPEPGMLLDAASEHDIDLARSFMVGDMPRDIIAGKAAGCFSILLGDDPATQAAEPDAVCADLYEAVDLILNRIGNPF
jgi:D-glycero-D-manno-heptose 1,7-bisphosphate phosphatase